MKNEKNLSARDERELAHLSRVSRRHRGVHYLLFMMIVLTVIYVVDEITSNMNAAMQPYVLFDLFRISSRDVNTAEYSAAINIVDPWQVASNLFLIITPFYKALSDRYGRRVFLMINTMFFPAGWAGARWLQELPTDALSAGCGQCRTRLY